MSKKISAILVCDLLNKNAGEFDGFINLVTHKTYVHRDIAVNSDVACSHEGKGNQDNNVYTTSTLGILNALVDETICLVTDGNDKKFMTVAEANSDYKTTEEYEYLGVGL